MYWESFYKTVMKRRKRCGKANRIELIVKKMTEIIFLGGFQVDFSNFFWDFLENSESDSDQFKEHYAARCIITSGARKEDEENR